MTNGILHHHRLDWTQDSEHPDWQTLVDPLKTLLPVEILPDDLGDAESAICESDHGKDGLAEIARGLRRQRRGQVVLTGDRGVGRTTLVRRLALAVERGDFPHLCGKRFLRVDVSNVGPEDSRACLESLISCLSRLENVVVCLDGMATLFPRANGGSNHPLLRTLLSRSEQRFIGIMTDWEFAELIGGDARMQPLVTRVRLEEPLEPAAKEIACTVASHWETHFNLTIPRERVDEAVTLAATFLLNQRHPARGLDLLWQACENRVYQRLNSRATATELTRADLLAATAELTSLPLETISGQGTQCDFEATLRQAVVGQDQAVQEVATELRLVTSGLTEPDKPASVLLFAGMTGVGKTELAKRIAELYSSSRRLNVYSMGNFTEPHSVSGLVGVPPGYVGHEQGGRLVNDLNADPYAVFLLDEAEKCHPNVWKPFLHLFDEGWIVDQRGVKAYADRAIFILTTNAGDRQIAQMIAAGKSRQELADQVRTTLARVRHERSSQVLFPPPFLARIKRILVFQPLDELAMRGITDRVAQRVCELWKRRATKDLIIADSVLESVANQAHALNQQSNGQEGGRIVRKLFADLVEAPIQEQSLSEPDTFRNCRRISVATSSNGNVDLFVTTFKR